MSNYNEQKDKITQRELNSVLNEKIDKANAHLEDDIVHITAGERDKWNNIANIATATSSENGLMSKEDKRKLDGIEDGANNYIHPVSGIAAGTYIRVTFDKNGHATSGDNPEKLNISVLNADAVGGIAAADLAKLNSPVFIGNPTCPTADGNDQYSVANVGFVAKSIKNLEELLMSVIKELHPDDFVEYDLTITKPEGCTLKINGEAIAESTTKKYAKGMSVVIECTADKGYTLTSVKVDKVEKKDALPYTFDITKATTLVIEVAEA